MTLSEDLVSSVAMLARLGLGDEEQRRLGVELDAILVHVSALQAVDTSSVPETAQVGTQTNVWREDQAGESFRAEIALKNAPARDGDYFTVGSIQE